MEGFYINIPTPCSEKWDEMEAQEKGRFCNSCKKTVIDFSGLSDAEIYHLLKEKRQTKICGLFKSNQLNKPISINSEYVLKTPMPLWKKFIAVLFICFSSFITGCQTNNSSNSYPIPEQKKAALNIIEKKDSTDNKKDKCETRISDEENIVSGEIIVTDQYQKPSETELEKMLKKQ